MISNFGKLIRKRRKELGMTIEQLAEKADVSVSLISLIERRKLTDLKVSNLERISEALDLNVTDFFKNENKMINPIIVDLNNRILSLPFNKRKTILKIITEFLHLL